MKKFNTTQYVISQIDLFSDREAKKSENTTDIPSYNFKMPENFYPQRSNFLFYTSRQSGNSKNQSRLIGRTITSTEIRKINIANKSSTPRTIQS
jgi:hypothetical protein